MCGGSGPTRNTARPNIGNDAGAADFADVVGFTVVQPTIPATNATRHVNGEIQEHLESLGITPSPYSSYEYSAIWVLGLSMLEAKSAEPADVRAQIHPTAMRYVGSIGLDRTQRKRGSCRHAVCRVPVCGRRAAARPRTDTAVLRVVKPRVDPVCAAVPGLQIKNSYVTRFERGRPAAVWRGVHTAAGQSNKQTKKKRRGVRIPAIRLRTLALSLGKRRAGASHPPDGCAIA